MNVPMFVMEDNATENLTKQVDSYMQQGMSPDILELIVYKILCYVQMKKSQGYANEYIKLLENIEKENNNEQSV